MPTHNQQGSPKGPKRIQYKMLQLREKRTPQLLAAQYDIHHTEIVMFTYLKMESTYAY